jgi:hypothetical protein
MKDYFLKKKRDHSFSDLLRQENCKHPSSQIILNDFIPKIEALKKETGIDLRYQGCLKNIECKV